MRSEATVKVSNSNSGTKDKVQDSLDTKSLPPVPFTAMFRYATKADLALIFLGCLASITNGAAMPLFSLIMGQIANSFSPNVGASKTLDEVADLSLYLFYFGLGSFVCSYIGFATFMITGERQANVFRREYFRAVLRQDIQFFDEMNPGELTTRISTETFAIQNGLGEKLSTVQQTIFQCVTGFIVAFCKGWQLALVLCACLPLLAAGGGLMAWSMQTSEQRSKKRYEEAGAVAEQAIMSIRTVLGLNGEPKERKAYSIALEDSLKVTIRYTIMTSTMIALTMSIFFFTYALGYWYGSKLILDKFTNSITGDPYTVGDVLTIFQAMVMGAFSLGQAPPCFKAIAAARVSCAAVFAVIDKKPKVNIEDEKGVTKPNLAGEIVFQDVRFSYPNRQEVEVLKEFNLKITPNTKIALVGESGCGKSTVMQLIERFYDVSSGQITIDGVNIKDYNIKWLRQNIGYVGQEPVLFNTSIKENMLIGRENATDVEIMDALTKAKAYDFVMKQEKGIETNVGTSGSKLSGGQKQRLAIARAILKNPTIMLLDEATSALDRTNEIAIQKTLEEVSQGRTTVVIAHRLSTIRDSDCIYFVDSGNIVEAGKHEELMNLKGKYYNLVLTQEKIASQIEKTEVRNENLNHELLNEDDRHLPTRAEIASPVTKPKVVEDATKTGGQVTTALAVAPELEKPKLPENDNYISRLITFNSAEKPYLLIGLVVSLIDGASFPLLAIILANMIFTLAVYWAPDYEEKSNEMVLYFVYLGIATFVLKCVKHCMFSLVADRLTMKLRVASFNKMTRMHVGWFDDDKNQPGALTALLASDCQQINGLAGNVFGTILEACGAFTCAMIIAFTATWKLTLVAIAFAPLTVGVGGFKMKMMTGFSAKSDEAYKSSGGLISEAVNNMRTVASFGNQEKILKIYDKMLTEVEAGVAKKGHTSGALFGLSQLVMFGQNAVIFYVAAQFNYTDGLSLKDMFQSIFAILYGAMAMGRSMMFMPDVGTAKNAAKRIFAILDSSSSIDFENCGTQKAPITGEIEFQNVSFKYPTRELQVLKNLSFKVKPGRKIALVGPSGCGKSTCLQLLQRFYDPDEGRILVDGRDIREYDIHHLRQSLGVVSQEPVLFNGTIEYNVKYANETATEEEMREAARQANALEFIEKNQFQEIEVANSKAQKDHGTGFQRLVGPKGSQISGGQKQRVAIARAVLKRPKVYLFDEATSALDNVSEKIVQESLNRLMENNTSVTVAHRLSTIRDVDEILVLHNGSIIERGNYDELIMKQGVFFKMEKGTLDKI